MAEVATEKASSGGEANMAVNRRPSRGVTSKLIGLLEKVVVKLGYDSSQPHHYLSGNFAPVPDETPPTTNLPVSGHLPKCLNGEFVQVGPNPKFSPVAGYHWFDGDGMTHGLRIKDGKASYVSRYVRTSQEEYFGDAKFMKICQENDARSRCWNCKSAGEIFTFGCSHTPPYVTYRVISKVGFMRDPVPTTVSGPIMMHDFAITENSAIFMDLRLLFKPNKMVKEKKLIFQFDATKKARFGVLPRYAENELLIKCFELSNCFIFHNANAWEEGDKVVLIACRFENPDLDKVNGTIKEKLENFSNELYEMRFNMKTCLASQRKLSELAVDFPRVNESYTGRKLSVHVIDAKTMSPDPVAVVDLPHRVPYGFHAFFVSEEQLPEQAKF